MFRLLIAQRQNIFWYLIAFEHRPDEARRRERLESIFIVEIVPRKRLWVKAAQGREQMDTECEPAYRVRIGQMDADALALFPCIFISLRSEPRWSKCQSRQFQRIQRIGQFFGLDIWRAN